MSMKVAIILLFISAQLSMGQPAPRHLEAVAYNTREKKLIVYGGAELFDGKWQYPADVYERDDSGWLRFSSDVGPGARRAMAMIYHPDEDCVYLFGGVGDTPKGDTLFHDVWIWYKHKWERQELTLPVETPSVAYDPRSRQVLLYGATKTGHELWSLKKNTLRKLCSDGPELEGIPAIAFDIKRNALVITSFDSIASTYEWQQTKWHRSTCSNACPEARRKYILHYDPASASTLLFGGRTDEKVFLNDLWSWDGKKWSRKRSENTPETRAAAHAVSTPDGMLIYGGTVDQNGRSRIVNEIWLFQKDTFRSVR